MEYEGPFKYDLILKENNGDRYIAKKYDCNKEIQFFKKPVTLNKTPKIYILLSKGIIIYVGFTTQSITNRLRDGLKKAGTFKDYKGYKWKVLKEVQLRIYVFDNSLIGNRSFKDVPIIEFVEAIEAELVYLIRKQTGRWPEYQNEIHFNNKNLNEVQMTASKIFKEFV